MVHKAGNVRQFNASKPGLGPVVGWLGYAIQRRLRPVMARVCLVQTQYGRCPHAGCPLSQAAVGCQYVVTHENAYG